MKHKQLLLTSVLSATLLFAGLPLQGSVHAATADTAKIVSGVNFRTAPDTSSKVIRMLHDGETVDILDKVNAYWYKVRDKDGKTGYVSTSSRYIEPIKTQATTTKNTDTGKIVQSVSFRTGPSTNDKRMRYLQTGETVTILDKVNAYWYKVRDKDGKVGYISTSSKYIDTDYKSSNVSTANTGSGSSSSGTSSSTSAIVKKVIAAGEKYLGTPYEFGSNRSTTTTFDCSDFVRQAYWEGAGIKLPSNSRTQGAYVKSIGNAKYDWHNLKPGDLMFFMSYKGPNKSDYAGIDKSNQRITHVAIYLGNGKILHTYSKKSGGVRIDTFEGKHWEYRFLFGGSPLK